MTLLIAFPVYSHIGDALLMGEKSGRRSSFVQYIKHWFWGNPKSFDESSIPRVAMKLYRCTLN
jgi:hypothetical protein